MTRMKNPIAGGAGFTKTITNQGSFSGSFPVGRALVRGLWGTLNPAWLVIRLASLHLPLRQVQAGCDQRTRNASWQPRHAEVTPFNAPNIFL